MRAVVLLLLLAGCGDGTTTDCACTVSNETGELHLGCGDTGCLSGTVFGCDEDNVVVVGSCTPHDLADPDGGGCVSLQATCTPGVDTCCVSSDGPAVAPTCDPTARRCCVAMGGDCTSSADCCTGTTCDTGRHCSL